jgi:hypothetical protein
MMTCTLERIYLAIVKHMVDSILKLISTSNLSMRKSLYQKSSTAVLNRRNELHLRSIEFGFAEKLSASKDAMQRTSEFIYDNQLNTLPDCGPFSIREILLMKSDFILFEVSASRRLISTIKEFVNAER